MSRTSKRLSKVRVTLLDSYRTASVLIRKHGDDADLVAAERADNFLEAGDIGGSAV